MWIEFVLKHFGVSVNEVIVSLCEVCFGLCIYIVSFENYCQFVIASYDLVV